MHKYLVWCLDNEETEENGAKEVDAYDVYSAAEDWAARRDSNGDYRIVSGHEAAVVVMHVATRKRVELTVVGETVPSYTAYEKDQASGRFKKNRSLA